MMVAPAQRPLAPAIFHAWQEGFGELPSFPIFNLVEDIEGHPAGSTVSAATLEAAGYGVPPMITVRRDPRSAGWCHAVWHSPSLATYHGHFATEAEATRAMERVSMPAGMGDSTRPGVPAVSEEVSV